jgi:tRNA uridine 5-carboxymethylaminomethyl modification enzyme
LTTGTFLNGLCHEGKNKTVAARHGDHAVSGLSQFLVEIGIRLRRFKTGTTPRVRLSSLDLSQTLTVESDLDAGPFSSLNEDAPSRWGEALLSPEQVSRLATGLLPSWQTRTLPITHEIIVRNLGESAMYSGQIEGVGPRYCPSIEDKVVRFAEKDTHPVWLEQETWDGEEVYVQGVSTSLPASVQVELLRTIPGMQDVEMLRPGYAVEYDMADPLLLTPHLMSKMAEGLFLAGQLNGTSGYEEAAGQGIVAGVNAAQFAIEAAPVDFPRDRSFIGVMVDDLVTKGVEDPYRLLLRHDNADQRLTPQGRQIGLVDDERWERFERKRSAIQEGMVALEEVTLSTIDNSVLEAEGLAPLSERIRLIDLMKRPEVSLDRAIAIAGRCGKPVSVSASARVREQLGLAAAYDGYIQRQQRIADKHASLDHLAIPTGFDYGSVKSMSYESREKLGRIRPTTVGQASRVPGVRPSDMALLIGRIRVSSQCENRSKD